MTETETVVDTWAESEMDSEIETETQIEVESENKIETEFVTETESLVVTETEAVVGPDTETLAKTETETETQVKLETETQTETETQVKIETETQTETETQVKIETETQTETETQVKIETETQAETETQVQTDTEIEPDTEFEADTEVELDTEFEADTEVEPDTEFEVDSDPESEYDVESEFESETKTETVTETETVTDTESETEQLEIQNFSPLYPEVGASVRLLNDKVWNFCDGYEISRNNRLTSYSHKDDYYPKSLPLSFSCAQDADYYRVSISRKADMSNATTYLLTGTEVLLEDLFTGTQYFWQVDAVSVADETTYRSAVYTFTTDAGPRAIRLDGVSNTRDAGGMAAGEGYRVKQGMIYRGGLLEYITPESRDYFVNVLGVKTDLDLRAENESGAGTSVSSPLGRDINYVNVSGRYYVDSLSNGNGINVDSNGENDYMLRELRVFANPDNYPIYVHCSLGRDRTGTLLILVQGLLGASEKDISLDYEFSSLSDYGTLDNPYNGFFPNCLNSIFNYLRRNYTGDTLSERIENYMLDIGLTAEEIASIKTIMLEEVE